MRTVLTAFLCVAVAACAGRGVRPSAIVAGAPTVAVLAVSTAHVQEFGYRQPLGFNLDAKRLERTDTRRLAIIAAFGAQLRERFAKAGYPVVAPETVAAAEVALQAAGSLDRQRLRQTLAADWVVLTSLSRWDEQDPGGGANAVVASLVVTLYDMRTGDVVWEGRAQDQEFPLANDLQREPADFVAAVLRRVMRDLPAATAR
jgi:hypothetical protein